MAETLLIVLSIATATVADPLTTATQQLAIATWALVSVGLLTLGAGVVAAIIAWRAWVLEAQPAIVVTRVDDPAAMEGLPRRDMFLTRDTDPVRVPPPGDPPPPAILRDYLAMDITPGTEGAKPRAKTVIEFRNVGRSPIADAHVALVLTVGNFARGEMTFRQASYPAEIRIPSIPAGGAFLVAVYAMTAGSIEVRGVKRARLDKRPARAGARRLRVAFTAEVFRF